ncbi:unnamed protein product [Schistosoma margrebowiei]|uniref:Phosphatidylinositol-glycan biosynthesis class X protein n=1 Tax=Schistosoma margrebowiei TaxID=48269 RepID=A0AA85AE30_9TREM|nr:unnamed protein product [Schistosoma margrebowiei]
MMIQMLIMCIVSILSFAYADITTTTATANTTIITLNNSVNTVQPYFTCNMTQRGFHLRLHCDFHDFSISLLEHCQLHVHLSSGFFIDPYELISSQPNLKFSISQSKIQPKLHDTIKQFVNWFTYSKLEKKNIDHSNESKQLIIQNNLVDIEAPEWLAKPLIFKFNINQLEINQSISYLDLPIHLRYHLPSTKTDNTNDDSIYITEIKHPILNCPKGNNVKNINSQQFFSVIVPIPLLSYLVFVMPITILLLIMGVIYLLMA